ASPQWFSSKQVLPRRPGSYGKLTTVVAFFTSRAWKPDFLFPLPGPFVRDVRAKKSPASAGLLKKRDGCLQSCLQVRTVVTRIGSADARGFLPRCNREIPAQTRHPDLFHRLASSRLDLRFLGRRQTNSNFLAHCVLPFLTWHIAKVRPTTQPR